MIKKHTQFLFLGMVGGIVITFVIFAIVIARMAISPYNIGKYDTSCTHDPFTRADFKTGQVDLFRCATPDSTLVVLYPKNGKNIDYQSPLRLIQRGDKSSETKEELELNNCHIIVDFSGPKSNPIDVGIDKSCI